MSLNERVPCPFDPVHVVERRRFQAHLIKCHRNLPTNHDFVQCPFWHLHYVRRAEFPNHLETCEHRLAKEAQKLIWEAEAPKYFEPKLVVDEFIGAGGVEMENWDDIQGPTFTAAKLISESVYMTVPQGLTKSQRKEFREKERERLREMEEKKLKTTNIKQEKIIEEEEVIPPPRKPAENPLVKRLGRIAAKFPSERDVERANKPSQSNSQFKNADTGNKIIGGRGRGTLGGWNNVADAQRSFSFSPNDFPNL